MKVKIGELAKIKTGKLDANAASEDGQYPFFTCSKEPLRISTYSYDCECVLVAGNGDLNVKYYNGKFDAYQRTYIIEDNGSGKLYMPYLYYFMESYIEELRKQAIGGVIKYIKLGNLTDALIELPSVDEQQSMVEILEKAKGILEKRNDELNTLDDLIKARFVEMFGDPVYNTNDLPIRNLNELGNWASGGTPSRTVPEYFKGNIDWYSAGELNTLFLEGSVEKITEEAIEKSATKLFKAGSLLIGMYDTAAFKMGILKEDSASNQACACITPNDEVNIIWLYYELQMMKEHFLSQRRGVRQKNLNLGMIKAFKIPIAKREQQDEFSDFVKQVNKSKVAIQAALDKSQLLFDSLMQKYFG